MKGRSLFRTVNYYCLPLLLLIIAVSEAGADMRYVIDQLVITLRDGTDANYQTIRTMKTDEAVEVLDDDGQFLKVRTGTGENGWVLKQYLSSNRPKSLIITELEKENVTLKNKLDSLEKKIEPLKEGLIKETNNHQETVKELESRLKAQSGGIAALQAQYDELLKKHSTLVEESKDVLLLIEERDGFKKANFDTSHELTYLRQENERMKRSSAVRWFLAGGGVFLLGLLFGKTSRKKKYY